jgi:hypothetical protein
MRKKILPYRIKKEDKEFLRSLFPEIPKEMKTKCQKR